METIDILLSVVILLLVFFGFFGGLLTSPRKNHSQKKSPLPYPILRFLITNVLKGPDYYILFIRRQDMVYKIYLTKKEYQGHSVGDTLSLAMTEEGPKLLSDKFLTLYPKYR